MKNDSDHDKTSTFTILTNGMTVSHYRIVEKIGVGGDDKTISTVDPSGIALAAVKELYKKSKEVDELKKQLDELSKAVEKLAKERK